MSENNKQNKIPFFKITKEQNIYFFLFILIGAVISPIYDVFKEGYVAIFKVIAITSIIILIFIIPLHINNIKKISNNEELNFIQVSIKLVRNKIFIVSSIIIIVSFGFYFKYNPITNLNYKSPLHELIVKNPLSNSIIIVGKRFVNNREEFIDVEEEPELNYLIMRDIGSGKWVREKEVPLVDYSSVLVDALPPGTYRVLLRFYEIILDSTSNIQINERRGEYIELFTPKYKGCVKFKIINRNGLSISNAFITISPGEKLSANRGSMTDKQGFSECTWLYSNTFNDNYYFINIYYPGKDGNLKLEGYKYKVNFTSEWENRKDTIVIK